MKRGCKLLVMLCVDGVKINNLKQLSVAVAFGTSNALFHAAVQIQAGRIYASGHY